ncbi:MAG: VIT1/CCC1 family predicted Fe2+/Mn2+ transporter [Candidatus Marinamargulisbacteria bacterium]|jgi:VIT1/CCC1 family predicted Fe2+/Mn2+ transporter
MTPAPYTKETFMQHLADEHKSSALSQYLKEIVYGGNDGIVTTFTVIAGFTGANFEGSIPTMSMFIVLLFGLANLFSDGIAMGMGNFLAIRADQDLYRNFKAKEAEEIDSSPDMEMEETRFLLKEKGFSEALSVQLTDIFSQNKAYWLEFMMLHELGLQNPEDINAKACGLATFCSFVFFGVLPLLPYFFFSDIKTNFALSCLFMGIALFFLGVFRARLSQQAYTKAVGETMLVGGLSGIVAFLIGSFFHLYT